MLLIQREVEDAVAAEEEGEGKISTETNENMPIMMYRKRSAEKTSFSTSVDCLSSSLSLRPSISRFDDFLCLAAQLNSELKVYNCRLTDKSRQLAQCSIRTAAGTRSLIVSVSVFAK